MADLGPRGEVHLLDHVRTLYRHRWTALTAYVVIVLSVVIVTFTATPIYEARTQLLIEPENPNVISFKEVVEIDKASYEYFQTQYNILKSRALAKRTLTNLNLWDHPEFDGKDTARRNWSIRSWFAPDVAKTTPTPGPGDETRAQSRVIDRYLAALTIAPIRNSRLVDIRFRSADPATAQRIANTAAAGYIQQNLEFKFLSSKEASDWLGGQLAEQRKKVAESEQALQRYREKGNAVALEDRQNIVVQQLADLNAAVTKAQTERIQKEAVYRQLEAIQTNRVSLDTFPAILSNTFIQQQKTQLADLQRQQAQLADKFGDKHPDMIKLATAVQAAEAKLQAEIAKVVQSVRNEYLSAQTQERTLAAALESQKRDALALNRTGIEYGVLAREVESDRQIYQSLLQRTNETNISGELKTSNIRIVDAAETPRYPVSPKKGRNILFALFGGALGAMALAFFLEYLDNKIKSPEEIKNTLGIPFIGMIPNVRDANVSAAQKPGEGIPEHFAESFRTIRTNVLFSMPEDGRRCLVVTSTAPGEGKSLVASNLAIALAQAGQRTLIIDGDMRKPRQHDIFGQTQEPGLSNLVVGTSKGSDAIRKTGTANLWVLTAGLLPPNPSELLGSRRFKEVLSQTTTHFDWVIVDSPPVMAVSDSSIAAHAAGGVLFVIGSEQTNRHAAREALDQLAGARSHILGAVLNRVDVGRNPYYYAHYYRREYRNYYTSETVKP
jgi:capsular exopolysaccharide synthesis family protein